MSTKWTPKKAKLVKGHPDGLDVKDGVAIEFEAFEWEEGNEYGTDRLWDTVGSSFHLYLRANGELAVDDNCALTYGNLASYFVLDRRTVTTALRAALRGKEPTSPIERLDCTGRTFEASPRLAPKKIGRKSGVAIYAPCGTLYFIPQQTAKSILELLPQLKPLPWAPK